MIYNKLIFLALGMITAIHTSIASAEIKLTQGVYEVPTTDPLLKPFATLKLVEASIEFLDQEKNNALVTYVLPPELAGKELPVQLYGSKTPGSKIIDFKGRQAESSCAGGWSNLQCNIAFKPETLNINTAQVDDYLRKKYKISQSFPSPFNSEDDFEIATGIFSPSQLDYISASEVAKQFSNEAIGLIKATKPIGKNRESAYDLIGRSFRITKAESSSQERWFRVQGTGSYTVTLDQNGTHPRLGMYGRFGRLIEEAAPSKLKPLSIELYLEKGVTLYLKVDESDIPLGATYSISMKPTR